MSKVYFRRKKRPTGVYLTKTSPKTVINDYQTLMRAANYKKYLKKGLAVVIKLNLSWTRFYPGCSTWPWQLEGIVKTLLEDGFKPSQIIPVENRTVVTDVKKGAQNNKWLGVLKKYGIKMHYLTETKYIKYQPKHKLLILNKIFPKGIFLPKIIFDTNLIHPPTLKMHVFTTTTGAIKNYFGMLNISRHFAHRYIHEALVDLLTIQKEIHPGIFSVTDGTVAGEGSGPRAMKWQIKNLLLASGDQVALDAVSAKVMGFEPQAIEYLRLADKKKLGVANTSIIQIIEVKDTKGAGKPQFSKKSAGGLQNTDIILRARSKPRPSREVNDISSSRLRPDTSRLRSNSIKIGSLPNFHFKKADTFASKGQKLIYGGPKWLEKILLHSPIVPWSYLASNLYHDVYWYHLIGKKRVGQFLKTDWGELFLSF